MPVGGWPKTSLLGADIRTNFPPYSNLYDGYRDPAEHALWLGAKLECATTSCAGSAKICAESASQIDIAGAAMLLALAFALQTRRLSRFGPAGVREYFANR